MVQDDNVKVDLTRWPETTKSIQIPNSVRCSLSLVVATATGACTKERAAEQLLQMGRDGVKGRPSSKRNVRQQTRAHIK
jgi:hypothetical protein